MTDFIIKPSKYHPFILTNSKKGTLLISGISIPESPESFYMPILNWINDYLKNESRNLEVNIEMQYFNNSTSKYFFKMLQKLANYQKQGKNIRVNWYYFPDDLDMKEEGEEFKTFFNFPFEIIEQIIPKSINKKKTNTSPLVYFDLSGDLIIEGNSTSTEPWEYYYPLIKWIDTIRLNSKPFKIKAEIFLSDVNELNKYYIKHLINELDLIEGKEGKEVEVVWKYTSEEIKNLGIECLHNQNIKHVIQLV
jgi:hypothetical protein